MKITENAMKAMAAALKKKPTEGSKKALPGVRKGPVRKLAGAD